MKKIIFLLLVITTLTSCAVGTYPNGSVVISPAPSYYYYNPYPYYYFWYGPPYYGSYYHGQYWNRGYHWR